MIFMNNSLIPALKHRAKLKIRNKFLLEKDKFAGDRKKIQFSRINIGVHMATTFLRLARCFSAGLVIIFLFAHIAPAHAQTPQPTPVPDDAVNTISRGLYCPVCQNVTLEACPTEACSRWREQVRELIGQGKSETEIRQYFIEKFGMRTVGVPTDTTGQILTIALPFALVLIVGGFLAIQAVRRRSKVNTLVPEAAEQSIPLDTDYVARLEQELKERK